MLTIDEIKNVIQKIAPEYKLKRVTLFGSRANGNFRDDSDIDLIVEFSKDKIVTLFTLAGLMNDLEKIFGVKVDIINGPKKDDWFIDIGSEIEIYES